MWDLVSDKHMGKEEQPLQVAKVTKIMDAGTPEAKYLINIKQVRRDTRRPRGPGS